MTLRPISPRPVSPPLGPRPRACRTTCRVPGPGIAPGNPQQSDAALAGPRCSRLLQRSRPASCWKMLERRPSSGDSHREAEAPPLNAQARLDRYGAPQRPTDSRKMNHRSQSRETRDKTGIRAGYRHLVPSVLNQQLYLKRVEQSLHPSSESLPSRSCATWRGELSAKPNSVQKLPYFRTHR